MKKNKYIAFLILLIIFIIGLLLVKLDLFTYKNKLNSSITDISTSKIHSLYVDDQYSESGSAEAMVIESNGRYGLIDTGNSSDSPEPYNMYDASFNGETVARYLDSIGVHKLDFIILTHAHSDHSGGIPYLVYNGYVDSNTAFIYRDDVSIQNIESTWYTRWYFDNAKSAMNSVNAKMINILDHSSTNLNKINATFVNGNTSNSDYISFTFGDLNIKIFNIRDYISTDPEDRRCLVVLLTKDSKKALLMSESRNSYNVTNEIIDSIGKVNFAKIGHYSGNISSIPLHFLNVANPNKAIMTGSLTRGVTYGNDLGYTMAYFKESNGLLIGNEDYKYPIIASFEDDDINLYTNNNGLYTPITSINITSKSKSGWYTVSDTNQYNSSTDAVYLYIGSNGKMISGFKKIGDKYYYFQESTKSSISKGIMVENEWKKINNNWYYFKEDGSAATGWNEIEYNGNNYNFRFSDEGVMYSGLTKYNDNYYYLAESSDNGDINGAMVSNATITIKGIPLNFDENGICTNPTSIADIVFDIRNNIVVFDKKITQSTIRDTLYDNFVLKDKNGNIKQVDSLFTNDKMRINNIDYDVAIVGDIVGDGKISFTDVTTLYRYTKGAVSFTDAQIIAGDMQSDNKISFTDVIALYRIFKLN